MQFGFLEIVLGGKGTYKTLLITGVYSRIIGGKIKMILCFTSTLVYYPRKMKGYGVHGGEYIFNCW